MAKKQVKFLTTGVHPALFLSDVDEYFVCRLCWQVARSPVACGTCEMVFCAECVKAVEARKVFACPGCSEVFVPSTLRRFPSEVYEGFEVYCVNYLAGCRFQGAIKNVLVHAEDCDYTMKSCMNPLCGKELLVKDFYYLNSLCSQKCKEVHDLCEMLGTAQPSDCVDYFMKCLENHRKKLIQCINAESEQLTNTTEPIIEQLKEEVVKLKEELEVAKTRSHTGKYLNGVWTCCSGDRDSMGCTMIK